MLAMLAAVSFVSLDRQVEISPQGIAQSRFDLHQRLLSSICKCQFLAASGLMNPEIDVVRR